MNLGLTSEELDVLPTARLTGRVLGCGSGRAVPALRKAPSAMAHPRQNVEGAVSRL
jgi:hypothetical protein